MYVYLEALLHFYSRTTFGPAAMPTSLYKLGISPKRGYNWSSVAMPATLFHKIQQPEKGLLLGFVEKVND